MIPVPTVVRNPIPKTYTRAWLEKRLPEGEYTIGEQGRYSFYYADDALAFVMKFGGEIIQNEKSFD